MCIALAGNISNGGDTYYFDIIDRPWGHWFHREHYVSRAIFARQKEVSRLLQQATHFCGIISIIVVVLVVATVWVSTTLL